MAANKRNEILQAAYDLFLEHGYDNASMKDIARKAGVSQSHPYIFFENKEELFEATIRMAQANYKAAIREYVEHNAHQPLEQFCECCLDLMEGLRAEAIFVLASMLTPKLKPIVEKVQQETARSHIETCRSLFPTLTESDLEDVSGILLGLFDSYLVDGDRTRVSRLGFRTIRAFREYEQKEYKQDDGVTTAAARAPIAELASIIS